MEPWPLSVSYRHTAALRSLSVASEERLSLNATPACFRSLGDARSFLQLLGSRGCQNRQPPVAPRVSQLLRKGTAQWLAGRTCGASALYRCECCLIFAASNPSFTAATCNVHAAVQGP